jgi:hypothetical protein
LGERGEPGSGKLDTYSVIQYFVLFFSETRHLDMQGGYNFANTTVPSNFSFGQH